MSKQTPRCVCFEQPKACQGVSVNAPVNIPSLVSQPPELLRLANWWCCVVRPCCPHQAYLAWHRNRTSFCATAAPPRRQTDPTRCTHPCHPAVRRLRRWPRCCRLSCGASTCPTALTCTGAVAGSFCAASKVPLLAFWVLLLALRRGCRAFCMPLLTAPKVLLLGLLGCCYWDGLLLLQGPAWLWCLLCWAPGGGGGGDCWDLLDLLLLLSPLGAKVQLPFHVRRCGQATCKPASCAACPAAAWAC